MSERHSARARFSLRSGLCAGLLALFLGQIPYLNAAPINDNCTGAEVIPATSFPRVTSIQDITFATTSGDPAAPSCFNPIFDPAKLLRSVWYSFTPALSSKYSISTCTAAPTATTVPDTVMAVYTSAGGCGGIMVEVAGGCSDDAGGVCGNQSSVAVQLNAGTRYYIVVWRYGTDVPTPDSSSLQLLIDFAVAPPNDDCANAIDLSLDQPVLGRTTFAANDYQLATNCFVGSGQTLSTAGGSDVVYSFTAPDSGNYSFRLSNFNTERGDPVLYVTSECPSGPRPIIVTNCLAAANRAQFGSSEEIFCLPLLASQRIFLIVDDDQTNGSGSSFILTATRCVRETEPNDTSATLEGPVCGVEGSIDPIGDVDFFYLGVPAFGQRLFAMLDGEAATTTEFIMRVVTDNGTVEWDNNNNDSAFGNFSPNLAGTRLENVPTYIRIDRSTPERNEPYRLYSVIQPPLSEATVESEPNDSLGQANFALNNYFYGTLSGSNDVDVFQFDAEAGDLVFVSLDGDPLRNTSPINAALELLDENGNSLVFVDDPAGSSQSTLNISTNFGNYPFSPGEALVYRASASATYFVRVTISPLASLSTSSGDYLLSITRNCVPGSDGRPADPQIQSVSRLLDGNIHVTFQGTPGVTYRMESSPDLTSWSLVPGSARTASGEGLCEYQEQNPGAGLRFYRAVWP